MTNFYQEIVTAFLEYWGYKVEQKEDTWWVIRETVLMHWPKAVAIEAIVGYATEEQAYKEAFRLAVEDEEFDYWL